ncbi:MAG: D-2-hydroxyacid dehydrogenase [bacterium]|nr:D-2-hydroxyacid dehydrogenase [Acidimicrobiia bacterium]MCY4651398.1 D-2-hydroxyacid dehydrogenase [bacterium]
MSHHVVGGSGPVVAVVSYTDRVPSKLAAVAEEAVLKAACTRDRLDAILPEAEIALIWNYKSGLLKESWHLARNVSWVHVAAAGVDGPLFPGLIESPAVMTNAAGVFDHPMAEWTLMMILAYVKELFENVEHQRRRHWAYREVGVLEGRRALIVGAGGIGRDIARMLVMMGMKVRGVARSRRHADPDFGTVCPVEDLDQLLPWADFVIAALPLTPQTQGLLGYEQFLKMKNTARFLNVGRGATVDEGALISALQQGVIAGAALDVFATEPLPPDNPLWELPNVYVSPHMSGSGFEERLAAQFLDNLRRFKEGRSLLNIVDKRLGFVPYRG